MSGIYAVIKRYGKSWYYKTDDHYGIYEKIMEFSNEDHELSSDAASWCELATVGEIYEGDDWIIEIQDND